MATRLWVLLLFATLRLSQALRLYPCGSDGYQEVEENVTVTFYCDQYSPSGSWSIKSATSPSYTLISTCDATQCSTSATPVITSRWISPTNSSVTTSAIMKVYAGLEFVCVDSGTSDYKGCKVHVIVPAVLNKPTTSIIRSDNNFTLTASSDVTRVYSSRGLYSCQWQLGSGTENGTLTLQPSPSNTSNTSDRTGTCYVTMTLADVITTYTADVIVSPGNTRRSSDAIIIDRPSPPVVTCPSDYVPENSDVTCTCSTTKIGQPGGRLQGYTVINSGTETVFNGNYDVTTMTMTWRVSRADHVTRRFGCRNKWISDVTEQSQATVKVAYGPDAVSLSDPVTFDTGKVNLTCIASFVQPAPTFTWSGPCRGVTGSTCTFTHDVTNNDDVINCTVTNVVTRTSITSNSVTLTATAKPVLLLSNANPVVVNVVGSRAQVTLDFLAVPPPNSFTIQPFGSAEAQPSSVPQNSIGSTCTAGAKSYLVTCNITIEGIGIDEGNLYELGVYNTAGSTSVVLLIKQASDTGVLASSSESTQLSTGAAVGVTIAVIILIDIVVVVVIIVFLQRRQWVLPCTPRPTVSQSHLSVEYRKTETPSEGIYEFSGEPTESTGVTNPIAPISTPDNYSTLQLSDIGLVSNYSEFTPYEITPRRSNRATEHPSTSEYSN